MNARGITHGLLTVCLGAALTLSSAPTALAHCDTLDGPVVAEARTALESGSVTLVLKWIALEYEGEVRAAFDRALHVRALGPEAKELADLSFFETLVRLHRAGEGEPYTGLKPSGTVDPVLVAADHALDSGSVDALVTDITEDIAHQLGERFDAAMAAKRHPAADVDAGRRYVAAYVTFLHYAEALHQLASGGGIGHGDPIEFHHGGSEERRVDHEREGQQGHQH